MSDNESVEGENNFEILMIDDEMPGDNWDGDVWEEENAQYIYDFGWDMIGQQPQQEQRDLALQEQGGPPYVSWKLTSHGQPVEVGTDTGGGKLYVGRAMHAGHLLPVKVAPEHQGAFLAWGGVEHSRFHGNFEVMHLLRGQAVWEPASDGDVPAHAFPVGCTAEGLPVFVARARHADTITPGRLIPNEGACYISYGGKEIGYKEYEVLTFS